ncbi:MAG: hypothetical protein NTZ16_04480 [Verrucomicrobia bacterium]|nr:hypothetical protein [Verrucomicrobiota bacterium]
MKLNGKLIWALPLPVLLLTAGCSGIHAQQSVSPASFFLPGLMQSLPPTTPPDAPLPAIEQNDLLAQVH